MCVPDCQSVHDAKNTQCDFYLLAILREEDICLSTVSRFYRYPLLDPATTFHLPDYPMPGWMAPLNERFTFSTSVPVSVHPKCEIPVKM